MRVIPLHDRVPVAVQEVAQPQAQQAAQVEPACHHVQQALPATADVEAAQGLEQRLPPGN